MSAKPKGKVILIDMSQHIEESKESPNNRRLSVETPSSSFKIHRSSTRHQSLKLKKNAPPKLVSSSSESRLNCYNIGPLGILQNTFQSLEFVRRLEPVDQDELASKQVCLPKIPGKENRKTLIFDLDETLVHCVPPFEKADIVISVLDLKGAPLYFGINLRPFARECLWEASKRFEVVVFTASYRNYGDAVVDFLDPDGSLVEYRLYRDSCIEVEGVYVKDLRVIDRALEGMLIIDNSMHSYAYELDNGIPVTSWLSDPEDTELEQIMSIFPLIEEANDVRRVTRELFKLYSLFETKNKKNHRSPPIKSKYVPRTLAKSKQS